MLNNDVSSMSELGMTFSVERNIMGMLETIDLIPNGRNILVTNENKKQYVKAMA